MPCKKVPQMSKIRDKKEWKKTRDSDVQMRWLWLQISEQEKEKYFSKTACAPLCVAEANIYRLSQQVWPQQKMGAEKTRHNQNQVGGTIKPTHQIGGSR